MLMMFDLNQIKEPWLRGFAQNCIEAGRIAGRSELLSEMIQDCDLSEECKEEVARWFQLFEAGTLNHRIQTLRNGVEENA